MCNILVCSYATYWLNYKYIHPLTPYLLNKHYKIKIHEHVIKQIKFNCFKHINLN